MSPTCLPSHQLFHIPSPSPSATPQPRSSSHYTLFPQYTRFPPPRILCQSFRSQLKCGMCLAKTSQSNKAPAPCARPVLFHTLFSCPFLLFPNLQCSGLFAALFVGHELLPDGNGSLAHLHPSRWPCTQAHTGHTTGSHRTRGVRRYGRLVCACSSLTKRSPHSNAPLVLGPLLPLHSPAPSYSDAG